MSALFAKVSVWSGAARAARHGAKASLRLLTAASIILGIAACSDAGEFDRRINSSDDNYMSEVAGALDAADVDFRALRDGSIAYRSRDEHKVASIEERLKKESAAKR